AAVVSVISVHMVLLGFIVVAFSETKSPTDAVERKHDFSYYSRHYINIPQVFTAFYYAKQIMVDFLKFCILI
ncbi:unnamed protein product, partial [Schistosoma turkestanicum]